MDKRILSLQSMRLVASLAVFQYHLWTNYLNVTFLHPGTDFFVVLVGMVAALSEARRIPQGNWSKYIKGRYLRLYVTFVPIFILYLIAGWNSLSVEYIIKSFFFIPLPNEQLPLVGPTWMLAMFLIFYWLFSLAFVFRHESVLIPIFSLWGVACLLIYFFDVKFPVFNEGIQFAFGIRNLEFIGGYFAGWLVRSHKISVHISSRLLMMGVLGIIPAYWLLNSVNYSESLRVLIYGLLTVFIATGLAGLEQLGGWPNLMHWLTHPWLVWLGATSYVLYLSHNMLLRVWDTLIPITIFQIPLITIVGLVVAAVGYQFWEKPTLKLLRRKFL